MDQGKLIFDMSSVAVCPKTLEELMKAANILGCGNDPYGNNQYLCLPNVDKTSLVEFCYGNLMGMFEQDPACQNIDTKKHCYTSQSFCQTDVNQKCHACDNNFLIVIIALLCVIVVISLIISLFVKKKKHSKNEKARHQMENLDEFDIKITEEKSDTRTQDQGEKRERHDTDTSIESYLIGLRREDHNKARRG